MEQIGNKLVIGLTGEKLAGKQTFTDHLTQLASEDNHIVGIEVFSNVLRDTLPIWHIPASRANLQTLVAAMRDAFGPTVLSDAIFHRITEKQEDIIILDGVRWKADSDLIRRFPNNLFAYVTAPVRLRWERSLLRGQNVGETETPFDQFMREEEAPAEIEIPLIGAGADFKIVNNGSVEAYQRRVQVFYQELVRSRI